MKKILFIGDYPNSVEPVRNVFFQKLIWKLADMGVECTVIAPIPIRNKKSLETVSRTIENTTNGQEIKVYYPKYVSFSAYKIGNFNTATLSELAFRKAVWKIVNKIDMTFDAVYGHFILHGGLSAVEISEKFNIPAFFACGESDIRDDTFAKYPLKYARKISKCAGVISVSTKNAKDLDEFKLFEYSDILIAPNAVETEFFCKGDKLQARNALGLPKDEFIAAFAGYFIERKGDKRVLEAAKGLDGIKLVFAGKGENPPQGENVILCRPLLHQDMPKLYQAADVFVLPTLAEGCCNSIVEAMACGLPVISSNLPFNDDILNEDNSIRVDPMSIREIHDALKLMYNDSLLRNKKSEAALSMTNSLTLDCRAEKIIGYIDMKATAWVN